MKSIKNKYLKKKSIKNKYLKKKSLKKKSLKKKTLNKKIKGGASGAIPLIEEL